MAFADPISVTYNAVAKTLSRINSGDRWSSYEDITSGLKLKISHVIKSRASRMVRLDRTVLRADPLTGLNVPVTDSCWVVYNAPAGLTVPLADQELMLDALGDLLKTEGFQDKFLNGES